MGTANFVQLWFIFYLINIYNLNLLSLIIIAKNVLRLSARRLSELLFIIFVITILLCPPLLLILLMIKTLLLPVKKEVYNVKANNDTS